MDNTIFTVLKLLGSLALLMYGMKVMSEGLQKLTGDRLRNILGAMTTNRFTGFLTSYIRYYGSQYRDDSHCVDYVCLRFPV